VKKMFPKAKVPDVVVPMRRRIVFVYADKFSCGTEVEIDAGKIWKTS